MTDRMNIGDIVRQHLEMEQFFGGFAVKGRPAPDEPQEQEDFMKVADKAAELDKLSDEIRQCCNCELGSQRTNAVPGEGSPDARIMFIGEAPGADEDAQGRPFVGRAGQLLDKIIRACGLLRARVMVWTPTPHPASRTLHPAGYKVSECSNSTRVEA